MKNGFRSTEHRSTRLRDFHQRFGSGDLVRTQAFNNFYPYPAVQRAYEEASFEIQGAIPKPG